MYVFSSVVNTKLPCYTLPPTQHHSFFRNLTLTSNVEYCLFEFLVVINLSLFIKAAAMRCNPHYPEGIVLLETRLFQGEISYKKWHIRERQDAWKPSDTQVVNVRADRPTEARSFSVQFRSKGNNGVSYAFIPTPWWRKCFDCFRMCLFCGCCGEN